MGDLDEMALFARVVRAGSLTRAAQESGIPVSTLSRQLARLEARLGLPLLERTTRRMRLTPYGATYLAYCEQVDRVAREAGQALEAQRDEPHGPLSIASTFSVDDSWATSMLSGFMQRYPGITLRARIVSGPDDPAARDVDILFAHGAEPVTTHAVMGLGTLDLVLCASPAYLSRHGVPADVSALSRHEFVLCELLDWQAFAPPVLRDFSPRSRLVTNDPLITRQVAIDGFGITLLPRLVVSRHLEEGGLAAVLPEQVGAMPLWMVIPRATQVSRRLEVLVSFLRTQLSQSAPWNYPGT